VGRLACIDLPAFPLQLLLRREPAWLDRPAAVVEADKPQAKLLWVNEHARRLGVLPGMRYSAALSLASELCAGVVEPEEVEQGVAFVVGQLRAFSPEVEPAASGGSDVVAEPGVFWVGADGLDLLYPTLLAWARRLRRRLRKRQLWARVAVGFSRFGTFAVARGRSGPAVQVLRDAEAEDSCTRAVPLDRLSLSPKVRDELAGLGVTTVADLLRLPPGGLRARYGPEAQHLQRLVRDGAADRRTEREAGEGAGSGEGWRKQGRQRRHPGGEAPLTPAPPPVSLRRSMVLDHPETNAERLLFAIKRLLHPLLEELVARRHALAELTVELVLDQKGVPPSGRSPARKLPARKLPARKLPARKLLERLRPAEPTVDPAQLLGLVLLRLDALALRAGVTDVALDGESTPATAEQLRLFTTNPKRDRRAARRAFARLRAEFGAGTVVHARLRDGHLPEACFCWEPLEELGEAAPRAVACRRLVRRCFARPVPLPHGSFSHWPRHEADGWQVRGRDDPPVAEVRGPYVVSGGWWHAPPAGGEEAWALESRCQQREYHYVENIRGECLWVYFDRPRRRWFLQGRVE